MNPTTPIRYVTTQEIRGVLALPAYLPGLKRIGLKFISLCENNPAQGLPLAQAVTIVMDAERGTPLAVLEAGCLTAIRTGAASGVAAAAAQTTRSPSSNPLATPSRTWP